MSDRVSEHALTGENGNNGSQKAIKNLMALNSLLVERTTMFGLRQSHGVSRDLYETLGYVFEPAYEDFMQSYERGDIAKRIVNAFPAATWRREPTVTQKIEGDENANPFSSEERPKTPFEQAWENLVREMKLFHRFERVDRLACIGRYAVMLIGLDDSGALQDQAGRASKVLFLQPFGEDRAEIKTLDSDTNSPRFGLPLLYQLTLDRDAVLKTTSTKMVHWSRILHVADGLLENDVYGQPILKAVFNRLMDLQKTVGGAAEGFWLNVWGGLTGKFDKDGAAMTEDEELAVEGQFDEYLHKLRRFIISQGMEVSRIQTQIADPTGVFKVVMQLISGACEIPMRILLGSEQGELASSQDEINWNNRVAERQWDFASDGVLRPFILRLQAMGVLPPAEFDIVWPDMNAASDEQKIKNATALVTGANVLAPGAADTVVLVEEFREMAGLDPIPPGGFPDVEDSIGSALADAQTELDAEDEDEEDAKAPAA